MKYNYGKVPNSQIIKNYKVFLDSIVVTFLDDTTCQIPYSEDNEQKIINMMVGQAKERNNSDTLKTLKSNRNWNTIASVATGAVFIFGAIAFGVTEEMAVLIPTGAMATMCALSFRDLLDDQEKLDDFKKYSLYLSLLKKGRLNGEVNINTLDQYSLKEFQDKENDKGKTYQKQYHYNA